MSLAVLLRNCSHSRRSGSDTTAITYETNSNEIASSFERYALQADSIQVNISN